MQNTLLVWLCFCVQLDEPITADALLSSRVAFEEKSEFYSTFEFSFAECEAGADPFDPHLQLNVIERGVFNKKGHEFKHTKQVLAGLRVSGIDKDVLGRNGVFKDAEQDVNGPRYPVALFSDVSQLGLNVTDDELRAAQSIQVTGISWEAIRNRDTELFYCPKQRGMFNNCRLTRRTEIELDEMGNSCFRSEQEISPVNPLGGSWPLFFGADFRPETIEVADDRLGVYVTRHRNKFPSGDAQQFELEWDLKLKIPSVRRVVYSWYPVGAPESKGRVESRLGGFVSCGPYPIATNIRCVVTREDGSSRVGEWRSTDLAVRKPQADDFSISLPETARTVGMNSSALRESWHVGNRIVSLKQSIARP